MTFWLLKMMDILFKGMQLSPIFLHFTIGTLSFNQQMLSEMTLRLALVDLKASLLLIQAILILIWNWQQTLIQTYYLSNFLSLLRLVKNIL